MTILLSFIAGAIFGIVVAAIAILLLMGNSDPWGWP